MEWEKNKNIIMIKEILKENNGYVTAKQVTQRGVHRMYLHIMQKLGLLEWVEYGIYIDPTKIEDKYFTFIARIENVTYSHMTALYFHGLSIKAPTNKYDITIKRGYHNKKLLEHNCFFVDKEIFELGRQYVETPMGNKVKAYDIERCICDIIKSKNRMDLDHVKYSVKQYIKRKDKNLTKLSMYAEKLGVKEEVMNFIELMYE